MATMSSLSDDGYEEDEESNVSKINLEVWWGVWWESGGGRFLGAFWVIMSSFRDDGYEEDEESNVSKINLEISLGGCFWVNWGSAGAPLGLRLGSIRGDHVILEQ